MVHGSFLVNQKDEGAGGGLVTCCSPGLEFPSPESHVAHSGVFGKAFSDLHNDNGNICTSNPPFHLMFP